MKTNTNTIISTLRFISDSLISEFPPDTDALWMSEDQLRKLEPHFEMGPVYVRIRYNEPLKVFTVFAKAEKLISKEGLDESKAYIDPRFLPDQQRTGSDIPIEIDRVDINSLQQGRTLTLRITDHQEIIWSEDEIKFASRQYMTKHRLCFQGQKVLLHSGSSKTVQGEVIKIYPELERGQPLLLEDSTIIHIEGFPENRQKVIDFNKIGGLDPLIRKLREIIQLPITFPQALEKFDIVPPKGLLLYGPPGNGKTMIARAIAESMGATFISIEGPELNSKYVGVAEQRLREKFNEASKYKQSVIFIDEIDSIAGTRDDDKAEGHQILSVSTLLTLMDGIRMAKGVFVIGATNRINAVDPALRRPGRFELEYEIPLPDKEARLDILKKNFSVNSIGLTDSDITDGYLNTLSEITNGYSGADLVSLYRLSVMNAISRKLDINDKNGAMHLQGSIEDIHIKPQDVQDAVRQITPTSLRGTEVIGKSVLWEDLIGLSYQKEELERIHKQVEKIIRADQSIRPSCMNLCLKGKEGSGRTTLIQAFCKHFNYELLHFDILSYQSDSLSDLMRSFERMLQKARQVAPSVFYIRNWEHLSDPDCSILIAKLKSFLSGLGSSYPLLAVIALQKEEHIGEISGYQGFNTIIDFPEHITQEHLRELSEKYSLSSDKLLRWENMEMPLGKLVYEIQEMILLES